jgi:hypothetical protein
VAVIPPGIVTISERGATKKLLIDICMEDNFHFSPKVNS